MRHFHDVLSIMFPFPLYFMEIKCCNNVLVSTLSLFVKHFSSSSRKSLTLMIPLDTTPLTTSRMPLLMIIRLMLFQRSHFSKCLRSSKEIVSLILGCSNVNARSRSMQPKTIWMLSFHSLKLLPFNTGIELKLTNIEKATNKRK